MGSRALGSMIRVMTNMPAVCSQMAQALITRVGY